MSPYTTSNIAGSVLLFAVGAVLRYAITATVSGVDLQLVGVILMLAAAVWFVVSLIVGLSRADRGVARVGPADGVYEERVRRTAL